MTAESRRSAPEPRNGAPPAWTASPPPWSRLDLLAIAAWTAAIAVIFRDAVVFRGALFYFDITELNYPYRAYLFRELAAGRLSFWLPNLYCGLPLFSESQAGYFHPLKYLLYPWLPTWRAFNLDTVLSVWLAGLGTYGWLRRHVGPIAALAGASIFGLGGYTWAHLIHTSMVNALASTPFAVWALESAWSRGRLRAVALGAIALAFQVFAGHLQDTILTGSALGVYTLIRAIGEKTARGRIYVLSTAALMVALAGLLSAVQWIPSKELLDRSPRAGGLNWDDLTYGSWHPQLLPALLVHEVYGTRARDTDWMDGFFPYHEMDCYLGVVGLFLAALGAKCWRDRWVGSWCLIGVIGGLLMLGRFTFLMDHLHRVPILGSSRIPVRFHLWVTLAAAALVAVGVDRLARPGVVRLRPGVILLGGLLAASVLILFVTYRPAVAESWRWTQKEHSAKFAWITKEVALASARNVALVLATLFVASRAVRSKSLRHRALWAAALPVFSIADMALAHVNDVPTVDPSYWTHPPKSVEMLRDDPSLIRIYGEGTYSSGEPGHASRPIDFMVVRETIAWSLPAVWGIPSSGGETPIISRRRFRFGEWKIPARYAIEGVSHAISTTPSVERLGPAEKAGAAYIHRNPTALPRARILSKAVYAKDERDAANLLKSMGEAARGQVVIEGPAPPDDSIADGDAKIVRDLPDLVEVEVRVRGVGGYLLLSDTYDPGWSATVDGEPAAVLPANVAFRAVRVPEGQHSVVFRYRPVGLVTGLVLSLVGLVVSVGLLFFASPQVVMNPEHGDAKLWRSTPLLVGLGVAVILAGSIVAVDSTARVSVQARWRDSFHPFTWGAKIEAIKPPPPPME